MKLDKNGTLPEGYNFFLHFDGKKVTMIKDGEELDVYGDGYYRDESDWYVPGYKNFTLDEKSAKSEIVIALRKNLKFTCLEIILRAAVFSVIIHYIG